MSTQRNRVQLIGNVGQNPESKTFESGKQISTFSMATNESYKNDKGEKVTQSEWHNICAWAATAKYIEQYVKKGMLIAVTGKLTTRTYTDKDGVKRYVTEIVTDEIMIMDKKKE